MSRPILNSYGIMSKVYEVVPDALGVWTTESTRNKAVPGGTFAVDMALRVDVVLPAWWWLALGIRHAVVSSEVAKHVACMVPIGVRLTVSVM